MRAIIFVSFLLGISCTTKKRLRIQDLKFPNIEQQSIAKNSIDTTFLVSKNWLLKHGPSDTIGIINYDTKGQIIEDFSSRWESFKYSYDSLGFLKYRYYRDWDVNLRFKPTYTFYPDSMILYQHWTGDYDYTSKFTFNSDGLLLEEWNNDSDNISGTRTLRKIFEYDDRNRIIEQTMIVNKDGHHLQQTVNCYFYSASKLDSICSNINSTEEGEYMEVTYYDDLGLKTRTIMQDSLEIRYIHHRRR